MRKDRPDLNADLGEGYPNDAALLDYLDRCSIACGGHAGNLRTMRATLEAAAARGVACGAHPSYPDREGFGRRSIAMDEDRLIDAIGYQIGSLQERAAQAGVPIVHVKPHGALYNDAAGDRRKADAILKAMDRAAPGAALIGPPGSQLEKAARDRDAPFLAEGFVDRNYLSDGSLAPRDQPDALLEQPDAVSVRVTALAKGQSIPSIDGASIVLRVQTLCVHGDTPGALALAAAARRALDMIRAGPP